MNRDFLVYALFVAKSIVGHSVFESRARASGVDYYAMFSLSDEAMAIWIPDGFWNVWMTMAGRDQYVREGQDGDTLHDGRTASDPWFVRSPTETGGRKAYGGMSQLGMQRWNSWMRIVSDQRKNVQYERAREAVREEFRELYNANRSGKKSSGSEVDEDSECVALDETDLM